MKLKSISLAAVLSVGLTMQMSAAAPASRPLYFADKKVSDDSLHDLVMRKLAEDADVKGGGLDIEVKDGVVTLRGKLESDKQSDYAVLDLDIESAAFDVGIVSELSHHQIVK